jgi:hypothetical protein
MRALHSVLGAKSTMKSGATVATAPTPSPAIAARTIHRSSADTAVMAARAKERIAKPPKEHRTKQLPALRQLSQQRSRQQADIVGADDVGDAIEIVRRTCDRQREQEGQQPGID